VKSTPKALLDIVGGHVSERGLKVLHRPLVDPVFGAEERLFTLTTSSSGRYQVAASGRQRMRGNCLSGFWPLPTRRPWTLLGPCRAARRGTSFAMAGKPRRGSAWFT
jgi:hypothetical protein